MSQTVFILPETNDTTLYLRLTGVVSAHDYMKYFDEPVKRIANTNGWYNLYLYHDEDFKGWSTEAADMSFRCISEYSPKSRRLAYVNAPDSRHLLMKMLDPMLKAEIRYFEKAQQQEALSWMKSYKAQPQK